MSGAESRVAAALMLGGGAFMRHFCVQHFSGVTAQLSAQCFRRSFGDERQPVAQRA